MNVSVKMPLGVRMVVDLKGVLREQAEEKSFKLDDLVVISSVLDYSPPRIVVEKMRMSNPFFTVAVDDYHMLIFEIKVEGDDE